MKRILAFILAFLFVFCSFVACNTENESINDGKQKEQNNSGMSSDEIDDSNNAFDTELIVNSDFATESEKDSETEKETESETESAYDTADGSELQKQIIRTVTVDNSAATTDFAINQSACQNTFDKVFLLSYLDVTSADYGMSNASRKKQATDYALSQGVYVDPNAKDDGYALWGLRSPDGYYGSSYVRVVESDGGVEYEGHLSACVGVVPALQIKL